MQAGVPSQVLRAVLDSLEPGPPSLHFPPRGSSPGQIIACRLRRGKSHTKGVCPFVLPQANISRIGLSEMMEERGIRFTDGGVRGA